MWVFVCPGEECEGNAWGCLSVPEGEGNAWGCLSVPERSARVMHVGVCLSRRGVRG